MTFQLPAAAMPAVFTDDGELQVMNKNNQMEKSTVTLNNHH
jgi:hypothetical protein